MFGAFLTLHSGQVCAPIQGYVFLLGILQRFRQTSFLSDAILVLSVNSPALILSKDSGISLAIIG